VAHHHEHSRPERQIEGTEVQPWYGFLDTPNFRWEDFSFRKDESFPGFTNFTLNLDQEDDLSYYNIDLEWSCPWNDFAGDIVDTPGRYEIVLRLYDPGCSGYETLSASGEVDATLRRLQEFVVSPGVECRWENVQLPGDTVIQSGIISPGSYGLMTIYDLTVTKEGNRLRIVNPTPVGEIDRAKPGPLSLLRNSPNPFTATTNIEYELVVDSSVELFIQNLSGETVRTLVQDNKPTGSHRVRWNGADDHGAPLASGLYFCSLNLPLRSSETRAMLLLK